MKSSLDKRAGQKALAALLAASAVLCALLAMATAGYRYDYGTFWAWAQRMAAEGPQNFYADGYFADYPPGYLWVLGALGKLAGALGINYSGMAGRLVLVLPSLLAGGALIWLAFRLAQGFGQGRALAFAGCMALLPALWFDTAVWKQIDAFFCLPLAGCFVLLEKKRWLPAALCYALALAVKPQALIFGPVLALAFVLPAFKKGAALRQAGVTAGGAALSVGAVYLIGLPFFGWGNALSGLLEKYTSTSSSYPYASLNAANLFTLLGGNWKDQDARFIGLAWQTWGTLLLVLLTLFTLWLGWRAHKNGAPHPLLLAAFYGIGVFVLGHRMHERYLVPAVVLLVLAAAFLGSRRLGWLSFAFGCTGGFNLWQSLYASLGDDSFLQQGAPAALLRLTGGVNVALLALLAVEVTRVCLGRAKEPEPAPPPSRAAQRLRECFSRRPPLPLASPKAQPRWTLREGLVLAALTLGVAALSFWYLGDTQAPQTALDSVGKTTIETVQVKGTAAKARIYTALSDGGSVALLDEQGQMLAQQPLNYTSSFGWSELSLAAGTPAAVQLENARVLEVVFLDAAGNALATKGNDGPLFDEADKMPQTISQLNSMYFDEIYHGRTGYEFLNRLPVYETTHPPLGKDFIALGIALFGMTGFGWRFFGALAGVLMVPALYFLVRRLSRRPWAALFAASLCAVDLMRFSQSRIATIDSYVVLFILLSAWLMVWYCQSVLQKGVCRSLLPMALCGAAFGLGAASKWTGLYAGAGLAVVYFGVLWLRKKQGQPGFVKEFWTAIGGGVLFFVMVPLAIYLASYLPYFLRDASFGLKEWWNCQTAMYRYHSTLNATHSFQSGWYSWPFVWRPVWYYMGGGLPAGQYASIAGIGNPIVWWAGFGALVWLATRWVRGKASLAQRGTVLFYCTQLLPWVLVSRCTFLYHYFPSLGFSIAALALAAVELERAKPRWGKRAAMGLVALAAAVFIWFYPAVSGLPVGRAWAESLLWLPSWGFYIL